MALPETRRELLNSWKEISAYLGRGVRTAQRWERYGLPVRRVTQGSRASVIAQAIEIDVWLNSAKSRRHLAQTFATRDDIFALRKRGREQMQRLVGNIAKLAASVSAIDFNQRALCFIHTELALADTFVEFSESSEGAKSLRNKANARKAFDEVVYLMGKIKLSREGAETKERLVILKRQLQRLGEVF